ncbi:hypothetical protein SAMN05421766_102164 [Zobellia uliginosa]|uniref:Uncharacterized protein n=1 Tax=Zobellia uliginosa TaxID=143224 RepID=A0ABY1KLL8_9FLAO|nr:hypothetical protein SAMN05421766_102164 [Zobellia uliginosa]
MRFKLHFKKKNQLFLVPPINSPNYVIMPLPIATTEGMFMELEHPMAARNNNYGCFPCIYGKYTNK